MSIPGPEGSAHTHRSVPKLGSNEMDIHEIVTADMVMDWCSVSVGSEGLHHILQIY